MRESAVIKNPEVTIGESEKQDYQTPDIYELGSLGIDSRLPKLNIKTTKDTIYTDSTKIQLSVNVPRRISGADIFLFNNGKKTDMYYQVESGDYLFRNIFRGIIICNGNSILWIITGYTTEGEMYLLHFGVMKKIK